MSSLSPKRSFSAKLGLSIMLLAVPIFFVSLGALFLQSRYIIRQEAVGRANSMLSATMQHVNRKLAAIENVTNASSWLITKELEPEALLNLTHRIVRLNPNVDGCSISCEPDVFPEYGKYFSVYSVRQALQSSVSGNNADSIVSVIEEQYEYFSKNWYKKPHDLGEPCWVDFFDEADTLELTIDGMVASYGRPVYNTEGNILAVISTDISLLHLSKLISEEKPYPNSYFMMLDEGGRYIIHPDSTRLFSQTIFHGADPQRQSDIIALGHEMTKGNEGNMSVVIDGLKCFVCYQPVRGTGWSLAIVCPDSDILAGYHKLTYIIGPLLIVGLIVILLICRRVVNHAIRPINLLLDKTQSIAEGYTEIHIPKSRREDVVGELQNSCATMLYSLNFHLGSIRYTTEQMQNRNEELVRATQMAKEAEKQKAAFIQNVSHQIRTPLNIIMGFAQILSEMQQATTGEEGADQAISEEERKGITDTMSKNSILLSRLVMMLFDSSDTGLSEELLISSRREMVACNDVAHEAIGYINKQYTDLDVKFQSNVADDVCVLTNRLYIMRSLREILYNSAKYSDGQHVSLSVSVTDTMVRFIVEDTGKGIDKADRELIFKFFTKVDDLSEGLGLGLPLAKRHAQNLGGDLTLDDTYHDGCRFILEIPLNSVGKDET